MRVLTILVSAMLLSTATQAEPTKQDCKTYVDEVKKLSGELGLPPEIRGRAMMAAL